MRVLKNGKELYDSIDGYIRGKRVFYRLYCGVIICLGVLLLCSAFVEVFFNKSICESICNQFGFTIPIPHFLNISSIQEVIKCVGLVSIPIVWTYSSLEKQEFGISYALILQTMYPRYVAFVAIHLVSVGLCIWLVNMSALEGAMLSVLLTMVGLVLHWRVIYVLILKSSVRREKAYEIWSSRIDKESSNKETPQSLLNTAYGIVKQITIDDGECCNQLIKLLEKAMIAYSYRFYEKKNDNDRRYIFRDMVNVWDNLLHDKDNTEQDVLITLLFRALSGSTNLKGCNVIVAANIVWKFQTLQHTYPGEKSATIWLSQTYGNIMYLQSAMQSLKGNDKKLSDLLNICYGFLVWLWFLKKESTELDVLISLEKSSDIESGMKDLLKAYASLIFDKKSIDTYFSIVWDLYENGTFPIVQD